MIRRLPASFSPGRDGCAKAVTAFAAGVQTGLIISQGFAPALFPHFEEKALRISHVSAIALRTLMQDLVDESVRLGVVAGHEVVAIRIALDALDGLAGVV